PVEPHVRTIDSPRRVFRAHHHTADDFALFDLAGRLRLLDGADNHVADVRHLALELALAAAASQHLDAHRLPGAGVVRDVNVCLLLNHVSNSPEFRVPCRDIYSLATRRSKPATSFPFLPAPCPSSLPRPKPPPLA